MKMKAAMLRMSKLDMLPGGMWKPDMVVFMAAPCLTKREAIWVKTTEYRMCIAKLGGV